MLGKLFCQNICKIQVTTKGMGRVAGGGGGGVHILTVNFKNNNFGWKLRRDFFFYQNMNLLREVKQTLDDEIKSFRQKY